MGAGFIRLEKDVSAWIDVVEYDFVVRLGFATRYTAVRLVICLF
jgi:hypothetical protein